MKKIMKILVTTLCLCLVTACGARDKDVNLEKVELGTVLMMELVFIIQVIMRLLQMQLIQIQ